MIQVDPNKRLDSEAVYALAVQHVGSSFSTPGSESHSESLGPVGGAALSSQTGAAAMAE